MRKKNFPKPEKPTKADVEQFDMLHPVLESIYLEFKELSKKKQDGLLNKLKVKITNKILSKVKTILKDDPIIEFLDLLDEESLPTNSDAVLIIAQFKVAMEHFKDTHSGFSITGWDTSD
ncbi:hypothetical protein [Tenacibaculum sp. 190524A05c]|uniref:hypothetical protein n=1 Tax=Tenacibaculum platacis TaxID=3137852 RepID=UPI0031FA868F